MTRRATEPAPMPWRHVLLRPPTGGHPVPARVWLPPVPVPRDAVR